MVTLPLTQGKVTTIDDEDLEKVTGYNWRASHFGLKKGREQRTFYVIANIPKTETSPRTTIKMHRLIMGVGPEVKKEVDHKDHNGLNNQKANLRLASTGQNQANRTKNVTSSGKPTSSRFKGVSYRKRYNRWEAKISQDGKQFYLGSFRYEEEAALSYNLAAAQRFGKWANLNIIN